ncbi:MULTISPECIES: hypothetical protein [unclassified Flammeovirga]|uniref:hypothetical protein n=1 Tax=unclassified Flammeovirga TaxID=2637820 RepID=UPI0005C5C0CB|nr:MULTISPECIES: hypothetical protein [unclassified Flammeovirga]MBD0401838.1 hypothetical protein [Flammeovirga sp. EKP202]
MKINQIKTLNYLFIIAFSLFAYGCKSQQIQIVGGDSQGQVVADDNGLQVTPGTCVFYGEVLVVEGGGVIFFVKSLDGCGPGVTRYPKVGTKLSARFRGELPCQVGEHVQVKVSEFEKSYSILEVIPL